MILWLRKKIMATEMARALFLRLGQYDFKNHSAWNIVDKKSLPVEK